MRNAQALSDKVALSVLGQQDWTYGALEAAILGTATGLLVRGIQPGDVVLMRLGNTVDFPIAYLGAIAVGIIPVPTSSQLTETETAKIISELAPAAVLRDPGVACAAHHTTVSLAELRAMHHCPPAAYDMGDPDRMAYVVYTSGTSGHPHAVAHAHRAIWARQMMVDGWYGLTANDRVCHAGAFNWTYTLGTGLMDPWAIGGTALIPAAGTDPAHLPGLLRDSRATIFAAAPGVYRKMLKAGELPEMPDLRHGISAGEKLSPSLHQRWIAATGTDIYEAYGMSECSTFISACPGRPARDDVLGRPQAGRRIALLAGDGPVEIGEEGTIAIHRSDPGLMLGYLNAPEQSAARFQGDWFVTGDQGVMHEDGTISYLGRNDDMMNAGGYRVSPVEVEAVLNAHPGIAQAGAAAVQVKADSSIIVAFYTGPETLDERALQTYVKDRLARYKQPRAYVHLSELPLGGNGKLLRRALPALFKVQNP